MILWSWITLCLRAIVATIFIAYAIDKLQRPVTFTSIIRNHRIIPDALSGTVARMLPVVELVLGLLLLLNIFSLSVSIILGILLVLFSGLLLRAHFSPQISLIGCGCSGESNNKNTTWLALLRNALLLCSVNVVAVMIVVHKGPIAEPIPLIEPVLLLCILVGVIYTQTQLHSSIRSKFKSNDIEQLRQGSSIVTMGENRRSFIKWGIQIGVATLVGAGVLWNSVLDASAAFIGHCPPNESCDCGPSGSGGFDCTTSYNCSGNIGKNVPITVFCVLYCCGTPGIECEYYRYVSGYHYCGNPGC